MRKTCKFILISLLVLLVAASLAITACTPDDPKHEHTFSAQWSNDDTKHWHEATCGHSVTSERAAHNFGTDNVCDTCGYTKEQGDDKPTTHEHTYSSVWSNNDAEHWHQAECEHNVTSERGPHTLVNNVCSVCGYENKVNWDDFAFERIDGGYSLTQYSGSAQHLNIPDTYNDLPVISIGNHAFYKCDSLTSVTIPNSVTKIENGVIGDDPESGIGAFSACSNLVSVNFGNDSKLDNLGDWTFARCGLTTITIPDSVTSIDNFAFYRCENLATVNFGNDSRLDSIHR